MREHQFLRADVSLSGCDVGEGPNVIFQHGLGGDNAQVEEVFPPEGFRRLTLECRAQGKSEAGDPALFSIPTFADDVMAFADQRGLDRFAVGGISMGAAIALRIAVIAPQRVTALILARPAWIWHSAPQNMHAFVELADYLEAGDKHGFANTPTARHFAVHAPDNLASMIGFFQKANPQTNAALLRAIAASGPEITGQNVRNITVPTLILGTAMDLVHPLSHAQTLASAIPNAKLMEIAPKALDRAKHAGEFRAAVADFLENEGHTK